MLALYRCGRQADALAAYQHLHRLLDDEIGVQPSPPLRDLHRAILAHDPRLITDLSADGGRRPRQVEPAVQTPGRRPGTGAGGSSPAPPSQPR
jgi:hypothetical protein